MEQNDKYISIIGWLMMLVCFAFGIAMITLGSVNIAQLGRLNDEYTLFIVIIWFGIIGMCGGFFFLWAKITDRW